MKKTTKSILSWYEKNHKEFPWRKNINPYRIWISEIMLQQTQIKTVMPYYIKWMKVHPTIQSIYKSKPEDLLKLWEGLGYYYRVKNIFKTAKKIVERYGGEFPKSYESLLELNGVGDYTASAILSIAYNKKYVAIDGNLKRVIARYFALHKNKQKHKYYIKYGLKLISETLPGNSNQALMDIGRELCKPKSTHCTLCPLRNSCKAKEKKTIFNFPEAILKRKLPIYKVAVGLLCKKNKFIISQRKNEGLLPGLWELPGGKQQKKERIKECLIREIKEEINIVVKQAIKLGKVKHSYSHFKVDITLYLISHFSGTERALESQQIKWVEINKINQYTFPTATHKLFNIYKQYVSSNQ